ncbi:carboxypeptidase-like regulatory domain-containing protein [Pyrinomonas methylaliphatogenes]|uniref:Carboxypeptidase regulatory-like domain n=1 Tax=Pyrinomonas methylaliphatogenes TaxID=454194 RepID=A0A0B6X0F6_9BACT|nr:carboxypeptidase-like regulatory domain-containing protein [Pyrinomonas methylaliphatogenes]CDM67003.1 hypothetical protein PYK22_03052 [Pyrinomonas methylaliphatogenes]
MRISVLGLIIAVFAIGPIVAQEKIQTGNGGNAVGTKSSSHNREMNSSDSSQEINARSSNGGGGGGSYQSSQSSVSGSEGNSSLPGSGGGGGFQATGEEIPNMGRAPDRPNGIGRLDLRVFDEDGHPISKAYVKLESNRTDGFFCEAWGYSDARGVAVLPPLHMGRLKIIVKARGCKAQTLEIPASALAQPVRVTLRCGK